MNSCPGPYAGALDAPLLAVKLHIPQARPECVPRPHLVARLNESLQRKLILVSAPAGFGKTTLLGDWARQSSIPVVWMSLSLKDNDPSRFWAYAIAALQTIHAGIGEWALATLQSPRFTVTEGVLVGLVNEIADLKISFALVLDDFHVITHPLIHDNVTFLLDNLPPQMHLVLAGRADPPWPLARLRARREMTELRVRDLRFTEEETSSFLRDAMQLDLSPEDAAALGRRTEGWIAGLQMAALALHGRRDSSAFVGAFSGTHRFILDYLMEEVLAELPSRMEDFLLRTSILERMNASLCDAVTGENDSRTMLAEMERANLFVVSLDDQRHWYRYHQLFADLLRSRLSQTLPDEIAALHNRASGWYEGQGWVEEAVGHALAAGDEDRIERLIAENALAAIYHGELATVIRWLDDLPDEIVRSRPRLSITYAWALAYAGRLDGIEPRLRDAERVLADSHVLSAGSASGGGQEHALIGHIAAIRSYVAMLNGDSSHAADLAREALDRLPAKELMVRGWTLLVLGCALRSSGDLDAASRALADALTASRSAGNIHLLVDVLWEEAVLQSWQGRLHEVMRTCRSVLASVTRSDVPGGRHLPVMGYVSSLMSYVLYEWNDLEAAARYAREGFELCQRWGQADARVQAAFYLARVLHAAGDADAALDVLRKAEQVAESLGSWYVVTAGAHAANIRLVQGDVTAATRWARGSGLSAMGQPEIEYGIAYRALARVLMAQGRLDEALILLVRLLKSAEASGAAGSIISSLVLKALVLQARGEVDLALAALQRALDLAEPEGYVRVFVREGVPMAQLLRQAAVRGIDAPYVSKLLVTFTSQTPDNQRMPASASSPLGEPLSERELEVLRLLATHLSGPEIACELFVAVNTVRSHIKSLYSKLDVHSRREAVARARQLGLL